MNDPKQDCLEIVRKIENLILEEIVKLDHSEDQKGEIYLNSLMNPLHSLLKINYLLGRIDSLKEMQGHILKSLVNFDYSIYDKKGESLQ